MKRDEITNCVLCDRGLMADRVPISYRVTIDVQVADTAAVQRTHGLEQFFGGGQAGAVLGHVFSPDHELLKSQGQATVNVCHMCSLENPVFEKGIEIVGEAALEKLQAERNG